MALVRFEIEESIETRSHGPNGFIARPRIRPVVALPAASRRVLDGLFDPDEPAMQYLASRDLARPKPDAASLQRLQAADPEGGMGGHNPVDAARGYVVGRVRRATGRSID